MSWANRFPTGHDDGGYCGGPPIKALFVNLYDLKQFLTLATGMSAYAQLASDPIAFHTGYLPVVTMLFVKTKPYISGDVIRLERRRIPSLESGKPVM